MAGIGPSNKTVFELLICAWDKQSTKIEKKMNNL